MKKKCPIAIVVFLALLITVQFVVGVDIDGGEIHSAETVTGTIDPEADTDAFTFYANAGQSVIIQMSQETGNVRPQIDLYSPNGSKEVTMSSYGSTMIQDHILQNTGQHSIVVRDSGGDDIGNYSLSLLLLPGATTSNQDSNGGEIHSAETVTGTIDPEADTDAFTFYANAGQSVIIQMSQETGNVRPQIDLYSPNGSKEVTMSSYGSAMIQDHILQNTGQYSIVVRDHGGDDIGNYSLSLLLLPGATTSTQDSDGGEIQSGETNTGSIDHNADTDTFTFNANAGQSVVIQMSRETSNVYPEIDLYSPNGSKETNAYSYQSAMIQDHILQNTGQYSIVVRDHGGDDIGNYSLSLVVIGLQPTVPSAPQSLQAYVRNDNIILNWNPPVYRGASEITNHNIYRGVESGRLNLLDTIGNITTYTDGDVSEGKTYYYQVSAVNGEGEGIRSVMVSATFTSEYDKDTDGDGTPDSEDTDDDNDGYPDYIENLAGTDPLDSNSTPLDADADGIPDYLDDDDDSDGYTDVEENAMGTDPFDRTDYPKDVKQQDTDDDGVPDSKDDDDDNDGYTDIQERIEGTNPLDPNNFPKDVAKTDSDGDDIPDHWEFFYGLNPLYDDADNDLDNDGYTNLEEFEAGSNPRDKHSYPGKISESLIFTLIIAFFTIIGALCGVIALIKKRKGKT